MQGGNDHRTAAPTWVGGDMGCLQGGDGLCAIYWLSKSLFLLGAGTRFLSSQGVMGRGSSWKSHTLAPCPATVHSPCSLPSIHTSALAGATCFWVSKHWLKERDSGHEGEGGWDLDPCFSMQPKICLGLQPCSRYLCSLESSIWQAVSSSVKCCEPCELD